MSDGSHLFETVAYAIAANTCERCGKVQEGRLGPRGGKWLPEGWDIWSGFVDRPEWMGYGRRTVLLCGECHEGLNQIEHPSPLVPEQALKDLEARYRTYLVTLWHLPLIDGRYLSDAAKIETFSQSLDLASDGDLNAATELVFEVMRRVDESI